MRYYYETEYVYDYMSVEEYIYDGYEQYESYEDFITDKKRHNADAFRIS